MAYSIFLYDYFFVDGTDLFPHLNMTKHEAEQKLFDEFSDSKIELIEEITYETIPIGEVATTRKENRYEYYIVYPNDFVEGAFLRIEKKKSR